MPPIVRHDSSQAERIRTANCPVVIRIGGILEVMWSKKFSDTSVDLYSSSAKNVSPKKYWGSVRVVKYEKKINRKNKLGDYLVATDENNETIAFSAKEFNIAV